MDDLSQQIKQILSDPQSIQQIQSMMNSLGLGGAQNGDGQSSQTPQSPPPQSSETQSGGLDPAALAGMLRSLGLGSGPQAGGTNTAPSPQSASVQNPLGALGGVTPEMLQTVSRIAPLLSQINREDDSTRLLRALRPLLSSSRQKKLDEAIKILQMMRLLPLLKESGVFSGLLSGLL